MLLNILFQLGVASSLVLRVRVVVTFLDIFEHQSESRAEQAHCVECELVIKLLLSA